VQIGGTTWSAPVRAGLWALINEARANAALAPAGILGPKIYPLLRTIAFRDITTGNNGAYSAGLGYDLCTGIGVPDIGVLLQPLTGGPIPPPAPPPPPPPRFAQIIDPVPESTLSSSTVTFTWTTGEPPATAYWLLIGNSLAAQDIYNSSQIGFAPNRAPSITVRNIPTDGRTIYVRLSSHVAGTWYAQDYRYTTSPDSPAAPVIGPNGGVFRRRVTVRFGCATPGATIYYTTAGSTPTTASTVYQSQFPLRTSTLAKAIALKPGLSSASDVTPASFIITRRTGH